MYHPFLFKFRVACIQFQGAQWVSVLSLPRTAIAILSVWFGFLRPCLHWLSACLGHAGWWSLRVQAAPPPGWWLGKWLDRNVGCPSLVSRVLWTAARSQGNYLSPPFFWLSLEVTVLWEHNIFGVFLILPEIFTVSPS